jgi:sugar phosphate isomerase/epimerase
MNTTNRRRFLKDLSVGVGALALTHSRVEYLQAAPLGLPIGLILGLVRDDCERDPEGTLRKVAQIGYKEVELYAPFFNRKPSEIRRILKENGLTAPSAHWVVAKTPSEWQKQAEDAKKMGLKHILGTFPLSKPATLEDYKRGAELLNKQGEQCRTAGIQLTYHNHHFEFKTFDGVVAYDELLRRTDPKLVKMEMDCFWVTFAGRDPVEYFNKYPGRFALLHIKDLKPGHTPSTDKVEGQPFTEVGRGVIDWKRIFAAAPKGGLKHYFVEQDVCDRPPLESIKISYDYLKALNV